MVAMLVGRERVAALLVGRENVRWLDGGAAGWEGESETAVWLRCWLKYLYR